MLEAPWLDRETCCLGPGLACQTAAPLVFLCSWVLPRGVFAENLHSMACKAPVPLLLLEGKLLPTEGPRVPTDPLLHSVQRGAELPHVSGPPQAL